MNYPEFYLVCSWDQYYPSSGIGNIKGVFLTYEEAERYMKEIQDVPEKDKWKLRDYYEIYSSHELPWMGNEE